MENRKKNSSLLSKWKNREDKVSVAPIIIKAPEYATIPLSSGQQRIWFLQQLYPENPFYNYSESLAFEGYLNVQHLKKSIQQLFLDNEILRSFYPVLDGRPVLKVSDILSDVRELDFSDFTDDDKASDEIDKIMQEQSAGIFNLARPGLVKVSLFKRNANSHILFLTMHHIIIDEWSIGILKEQLASNYRKLSKGLNLEPHSPYVQFSDYSYWERNKNIDTVQLNYWKEILSDNIPILNLQTDYNRPVRPAFKGKQFTQYLSTKLSSQILGLSKNLETTPFVFLLTVYYILLQRYSGQEDILVGTPVSNRSVKSLENILGFFIDTVVLRNKVDTSLSFSELVKVVKKNTLDAFSNKEIPFDTLVKELKVERSLAINPFFQVMFLYHPETKAPSFGNRVRLAEQAEFDTEVAKFDLTLSISESEGLLALTFEYDTDLFQESTITRFLEHYQVLLKDIVQNPDTIIGKLAMLTESEKDFFLEKPVSSGNHLSSYSAIHHLIEDVCKTFAKNTAVSYKNQSLTYEELDSKAGKLALSIVEKTKKRNEIVGLCVDKSVDMIVGLLAILKAGCAYLPIDPKYPLERLSFILEDAQCDVIVTHSSLNTLFEDSNKEILAVNHIDQAAIASDVEIPKVNEEDIAYVIYTSGSTGKPKGVPISHKNIINSTAGRLVFYPNSPDAFLLMSSISFDSSKAGIFWTLCTGGNLIITENRIEQDISKIETLIENHAVTHTLMLPSLYKLILEHGTPMKLGSLNTVVVAGEACTPSICEMHFDRLPNVNLYNEYGPTEATVWCIAHQIEKSDISGVVPIGKAVADAKVYLLDKNLNLVPYGAVGEIYVGGPGLAKGYINRADLSAEAFIANPFGSVSAEKIYKTGDLGRFRNDGAIEFLGRADHQVKIRGFRVELDEIEKAISGDNSITDVVVMVVESRETIDMIDIGDLSNSIALGSILKQNLSSTELNEFLSAVEFLKTERSGHFSQK